MNTELVDRVLAQTREYLANVTAQPQVARSFEVASEQSDEMEEVGIYLFEQQNKNK